MGCHQLVEVGEGALAVGLTITVVGDAASVEADGMHAAKVIETMTNKNRSA
jgi:hypothetical protein